ncbi:hypothetical protein FZEAL_1837 [Fusarium zealandicum]|uniref:Uncharacterized protein n=1 Tax=Fusarium zealandicum TaxID=1053134 RepID=A0A8H4URX4_9HYPO|nr:hypothetical protein FZEAL_1837 [Fusarium zealandicum]
MLLRAIERFHHVSSVPCRRLSSCPGPIESRRRLGKRHMTAILPDSRASPLPWTIELPFSLGEWNWEAPTAPENRHKKRVGLLERFIRWLEGPAQEGPTQEDTSAVAETLSSETTTISPVQNEICRLQDRLSKFINVNNRWSLWKTCEPSLKRLIKMIHSRMVTCDDLLLTLDPFDSGLKQRISAKHLDFVRAKLWLHIIDAIHKSRITPSHDAYGDRLWHRCFEEIVTMTPQQITFLLFRHMTAKAVREIPFVVPHDFYFRMVRAHIMFEAARPVNDLARSLRAHQDLWQVIHLHKPGLIPFCFRLLDHCTVRDTVCKAQRRRIAFHVIMTFAHMPYMGRSFFTELVRRVERAAGCDLTWSPKEILYFTRARLITKSRNTTLARSMYDWSLTPQGLSWTTLVRLAYVTKKARQPKNLRTVIHSSKLFGQLKPMLEAVATLPEGGTALRDIFVASRSRDTAVAAWEAYSSDRDRPAKWNWSLWLPYVKSMVLDPAFNISTIWESIDLLPFRSIETLPPEKHWEGIGTRMGLLEKMSEWFMSRPGFSRRQRLRYVERTIAYAKVAGGPVSTHLINNLATLIVIDLEEGNPGRTTRLNYLIAKTDEYLGHEQAEALKTQLRGWRYVVLQEGARKSLSRQVAPRFDAKTELRKLEEDMNALCRAEQKAKEPKVAVVDDIMKAGRRSESRSSVSAF